MVHAGGASFFRAGRELCHSDFLAVYAFGIATVGERSVVPDNVKIGKNVVIEKAMIAEGAIIKDNAVIKDDNNEISVISEYEVVEGERAKVEA